MMMMAYWAVDHAGAIHDSAVGGMRESVSSQLPAVRRPVNHRVMIQFEINLANTVQVKMGWSF